MKQRRETDIQTDGKRRNKLDYRSQLTNCYWHQTDRQKQKQITFSIIGFIGVFPVFLKWIKIEFVQANYIILDI